MYMNTARVALTFAGCFLGAGYVSGQELWQFFGSFGTFGFFGMIVAMLLIFLFGVLLLRLASISKIAQCDKLIIRADNKFLRAFIGVAETFFLVGISVIMTAGVGALFRQTLGLSEYLTGGLFALLLFFLSLGGHQRMVSVFSMTVPFLIVFTLVVAVVSVSKFGFPDISSMNASFASGKNPLLSSWWISAVTFVCYNLFSSVQILAPVGVMVDSKKRVWLGVFFGTFVLFVIACSIFLSMASLPASSKAPLPMLFVASELSQVLGVIYSVLLFFGMLGTGLSCLVAVTHFVTEKTKIEKAKLPITLVLSVFIYFGSLFGFGDLIGVVYPLCGYLGVLAIAALCEHYFHIRKTAYKNKQDDK